MDLSLVASLTSLLTAILGFIREVVKWPRYPQENPASPTPTHRRSKTWIFLWLLTIALSGMYVAYWRYCAGLPSVFIYTRINSFDPAQDSFGAAQFQSYFSSWSTLPYVAALEKRFGPADDSPDMKAPSIELLYLATDKDEYHRERPSQKVYGDLRAGSQHHLIVNVKNMMSVWDKEGEGWGDCEGWTGLQYTFQEPEKVKEAILALDFSEFSKSRTCNGTFFQPAGEPRYRWLSPDDLRRKPAGSHQCLDEFEEMKAVANGSKCYWIARLDNVGPGKIMLRWRPQLPPPSD